MRMFRNLEKHMTLYFACTYFGHNYVIHMDNRYTSPITFYNLRNVQTGACGTVKQNRIGLPREYAKLQVKKKGDKLVYSYDNQMQVIKILTANLSAFCQLYMMVKIIILGKGIGKLRR